MLDSIRGLIDDHVPADDLEARHLDTMRRALGRGDAVCTRSWFDPGHFTASAFVLSPAQDSLLLVHHSKLRRWLQPGGHVEAGDTDPLAAARREVLEETGLDRLAPIRHGLLDVDVHEIPPRADEPAHLHLDLRFAFVAGHCGVAAGDGVDAVRFVPLDHVERLGADASVLRAVDKLSSTVAGRARA
ncbi:MAG TPA: NUDIX hydrolase [Candidatus Krumholzibacteria bacterium]|nr:NUDIX hydrolase [Candidatus Krumholzibacteria bacterium]